MVTDKPLRARSCTGAVGERMPAWCTSHTCYTCYVLAHTPAAAASCTTSALSSSSHTPSLATTSTAGVLSLGNSTWGTWRQHETHMRHNLRVLLSCCS